MHEIFNTNVFLVKQHVAAFKAARNYDIYDTETGQIIMECREHNLGFLTRLLRFTDFRRMTPFDIQIRTLEGKELIRMSRGIAIFLSHVKAYDENNTPMGSFRQKFASIGGAFEILNARGDSVCSLKGKWTGWDFRFVYNDIEFAHVTKKWTGLGKELLTSADSYIVEILADVSVGDPIRQLIIGAVMCIDMVLKE